MNSRLYVPAFLIKFQSSVELPKEEIPIIKPIIAGPPANKPLRAIDETPGTLVMGLTSAVELVRPKVDPAIPKKAVV